jgi:membrane protein implicated in regulation of membrane protease activity
MSWPDIFLLCFAVGTLWALASLLLGGMHLGHTGSGHAAGHMGHAHLGHAGHGGVPHGHGGVPHGHGGHALPHAKVTRSAGPDLSWVGSMANPSCAAVFLAWFGGVGYLLMRHSGLAFWIDLALALALGVGGAWILAAFLRFLQSREQPLNPADYDLVGVLGEVTSTIRADGVGELIYVRDGARRALCARSEDRQEIRRGEEVVVTRFEKGIAYVRTWEAMTQSGDAARRPEALHKEMKHVE